MLAARQWPQTLAAGKTDSFKRHPLETSTYFKGDGMVLGSAEMNSPRSNKRTSGICVLYDTGIL